jgi:ribosomal protein S12 methylthiotransferase
VSPPRLHRPNTAPSRHTSDGPTRSVSLVTLGCARNEVDSEELAGSLSARGWQLVESEDADVVVVNTCGFIDSAKKDSIDTLLAAAEGGKRVVAVGCLAERYGDQLAEALPEADAILGFDSYSSIDDRLEDVLAGRPIAPHHPADRRTLLPISPAQRPQAVSEVAVPGHQWGPTAARKRLDDSPVAYLKLASGCDRRCTFCAIPSFRGAFVSRAPADVLAEAEWLAGSGVRELVLVSENSTSYGKDLGDLRALETLLPRVAGVEGIERVRVSYLQPAELRPSLLQVIAQTPGVVPYFDLSFQHASTPVLRRMKRFGSTESFVDLLDQARTVAPTAGARSNVIVGFPGETEADLAELERFLTLARLDVVGVFGYSDEEGTDAAGFDGKLAPEVIAARVERVSALADELVSQRAEDRIGELIEVLVEEILDGEVTGRAAHQAPETDGAVTLTGSPSTLGALRRGHLVRAEVTDNSGADLIAEVVAGSAR